MSGARGRGGYAAEAAGASPPGRGKGVGKGKGGGAARAGDAQPGALAALSAICAYEPKQQTVFAVPELQVGRAVAGCSVQWHNAALLFADGAVLCQGDNYYGELGAGDCQQRQAAEAARLPWPATLVRYGRCFAVALRRGGAAVCSWGVAEFGRLGRPIAADGDGTPTEVPGLPPGDPVTLLDAGYYSAVVVTQSGEAYGWGNNAYGQLALPLGIREQPVPRRIEALCGRGLCRLTCGARFAVAETRSGELLCWGMRGHWMYKRRGEPPAPLQPRAGRILYPLRSLAAGEGAAAAADASGQLWCLWEGAEQLTPARLPPGERVAQVAACLAHGWKTVILAATVWGRLWDCRAEGPCRSITAPGAAPLGLLPHGGPIALRAILVPDHSCGLRRCRLLLLVAGRRELLLGGEMPRLSLVPFLVDENCIFEQHPESE